MNKMTSALTKTSLSINGHAEIIAAFAVVGIVFMMILPLPNTVIDGLIALNICLSFLLVMLSMYFPSPLYFSTFPAVLLFTTLFRLALSISTTRMILLEADAGNIVTAFGNFVVGGNLAVGVVIFLILTIVQFLVITKGSERVAEVSARFTLDAMPGKQMSIDSDLRAGLLSAVEAKKKRNDLAKTNQLFGAMDGAMKFVKGDAIAGIVIVLVNLIGGASIGVSQHGLSPGESMQLYSILTIGDGLVAQIPALLISLTAGMIITRVTNEDDEDANVGRDIAAQLTSQPKAWVIAGLVMFGFSMVPGMPTKTFIAFSLATFSIGFYSILTRRRNSRTGISAEQETVARESKLYSEDIRSFSMTRDYLLLLNSKSKDSQLSNELIKIVRKTRNEIVINYGFTLPNIMIDYVDDLDPDEYRFCVSEIPVVKGLMSEELICIQVKDDLFETLDIQARYRNVDANGVPLIWVDAKYREMLTDRSIYAADYLTAAQINIRQVFQKTGPRFIGVQETQKLIGWLQKELPELAKELERVVSISMLSEILQRLAAEGVSIRCFRVIAETLVEHAQAERDPGTLTDLVRIALKNQICHEFSKNETLNALLFTPQTEDMLRNSIRQTTRGGFFALDPDTTKSLLNDFERIQEASLKEGDRPIILAAADIRRYVWELIKDEKFSLPVLSYSEVTTSFRVKPIEIINL
ncbi:EscV/YscV/HrcV family type III secretion system export apparatus protein [Exilibacterium tricleocarpae]|uniref:EscV/YscV/HrcV family type III secretion system export apparatus protein n=1 Tax=Exilibacterium tricleocarpae TaxID=2591008 RepID=A0A545U3P2_9GAMM|nr:type III secretion system export apparatus subunit SctV [Exilibacterium tricleocarpae]TQV84076.1 EscV/YscV/HrcV family type III secretion system export apparatus protein [Exilibacterium tricleocarpae]